MLYLRKTVAGRILCIVCVLEFSHSILVSGTTSNTSVIVRSASNILHVRRNAMLVVDCPFTSNAKNTTYFWTKDGVSVASDKRVQITENGSLIIQRFVTKRKGNRSSSGFYQCFVKNEFGIFVARLVQLSELKNAFTAAPQDVSVALGGIARFYCEVTPMSEGKPCYQWTLPNGDYVPLRSERFFQSEGLLQIYNVTQADRGPYTCIAFFNINNNHDILEKSAVLNIFADGLSQSPKMIKTPEKLIVEEGWPALIECLVESNDNAVVTWYFPNQTKIVPGKDVRFSINGFFNLKISKVSRSDSGKYMCEARTTGGLQLSRNATLDVYAAPTIISAPNPTYDAKLMRMIPLKCVADGHPQPSVSWYKNGLRLYPAPGHTLNNELILLGNTLSEGYYQCVANNSVGTAVATSRIGIVRQSKSPEPVTITNATAISATDVNFTWSPVVAVSEADPITAYTVDFHTAYDSKCPGRCEYWAKIERCVLSSTGGIVSNLNPFTSYSFQVQVITKNTASPLSKAVVVTTLAAEMLSVELRFQPLNSTSVLAKWNRSDQSDSRFGSYRIIVKKPVHGDIVKEYNLAGNVDHVLISPLVHREFYQIELMIQDRNKHVIGAVTDKYQAVEPDDERQTPPPTVFNPPVLSSSAIVLSWERPQTDLRILWYTVRFQRKDMLSQNEFVDTNDTHVVLQGLQAFTWYVIAVSSHTAISDGPFSKPVIVQSKEGIPSSPQILSVEVVSPGKVKLEWKPPREQNGILTHYIIYYNEDKNVPDRAWESVLQNATANSILLEDLMYEVYFVKLRACTNAGEGNYSHIVEIDTKNCANCIQCTNTQCQNGDERFSSVFEQRLGIIIGCVISIVCVIVCVIFMVGKHRHFQERHRQTNVSYNTHLRLPQVQYLAQRPDCRMYKQGASYSPLLAQMIGTDERLHESKAFEKAVLTENTASTESRSDTNTSDSSDSSDTTSGIIVVLKDDTDDVENEVQANETDETGFEENEVQADNKRAFEI